MALSVTYFVYIGSFLTHFHTVIVVNWQVGYLLGLGDRHPSNLMLDRHRYSCPIVLLLILNIWVHNPLGLYLERPTGQQC